MSSSEIHISLRDLEKHYKLGETEVIALDKINLDIKRGEFVIIIGPSGSGKSTLVNMIGGVDKPDAGTVNVSGTFIHSLNTFGLTKYRRDYVGFVFQFYSLVPTLTARENIEMAAELVNIKGKELYNRCSEVLEAVGLKDRGNSYPSQLSGGERQRVALGRAIAKHPELIIVDEPTGQLDTETGRNMVKLIRDVAKKNNATVVMVTHDVEVLDFADRVLKMRNGKIIEEE